MKRGCYDYFMTKIKFLLSVVLAVAITVLVGSNFYGNPPIAQAIPGVGWTDDGTVVRLDTSTDSVGIGTTSPGTQKLGVVGLGLFAGILTVEDHIKTTNLIATGTINVSGNILVGGLVDGFDISSSSPSWDQAFNQRNRWDGGSDGLNAATGRTSLGLGSLATANAVSGGSGGTITDNSITNHDLATSTFWNIAGVGAMNHVVLRDTDGSDCHKVTVNSAGVLSTAAVNCDTGDAITGPGDSFDSYSAGDLTGNNGGSGWSEAWQTEGPDTFDVVTSSCSSGNCVKGTGGAAMGNDRNFTSSMTDGTLTFKTKVVEGLGATHVLRARVSGESIAFTIQTRSDAPGDKIRLIGSSTENLGDYTESTWQTVDVEFGDTGGSGTCAANQVRARLDGGSWSSCINYSTSGALVDIFIEYSNSASAEYWIDEIQFGS